MNLTFGYKQSSIEGRKLFQKWLDVFAPLLPSCIYSVFNLQLLYFIPPSFVSVQIFTYRLLASVEMAVRFLPHPSHLPIASTHSCHVHSNIDIYIIIICLSLTQIIIFLIPLPPPILTFYISLPTRLC